MVVSQRRGDPNVRPQYAAVLIIGTPKEDPLILGNPKCKAMLPNRLNLPLTSKTWVPEVSYGRYCDFEHGFPLLPLVLLLVLLL